jgi:hypothetical protein
MAESRVRTTPSEQRRALRRPFFCLAFRKNEIDPSAKKNGPLMRPVFVMFRVDDQCLTETLFVDDAVAPLLSVTVSLTE